MSTDQLIDAILAREGGGAFTNDPIDKGGPTRFGITARTLANHRGLGRSATIAEVKALTEAEARAIYRKQYIAPFDKIPFDSLKAQIADFAVTSGAMVAVQCLQRALGVDADGVIGDRTRTALLAYPWKLSNNALVAFRCQYYAEIVQHDPRQAKWIHGWIVRAISFLV